MHATVSLLRAGQPRRAGNAAKSGQFIGQFLWVKYDPVGIKVLNNSLYQRTSFQNTMHTNRVNKNYIQYIILLLLNGYSEDIEKYFYVTIDLIDCAFILFKLVLFQPDKRTS